MTFTNQQVLEALSHVEEPDLKKDLVTLNMVENISCTETAVTFTIILTTPACPLKKVIEDACRKAIHDYMDPMLEVNVLMTSRVTSANKNDMFPDIRNIILVSSGKGGVGKSTVAANLALALAKKGAAVGLIDADIYGPSIPIMFQLEGAKPKGVIVNGKSMIEPIEKYGIKLLSIGFFSSPGQPIPWRGPMVSTAVKQLFNDAHWGALDYLIVDLPPGTGDIHITVAQTFPVTGAVIVTTPQKVSLADTAKGIGMFLMDSIHIPVLGIVENMAYFTPAELPENKYYIFGKSGGKILSQQFDIPLLEEIPLFAGIAESGDEGIPIVLNENHPGSEIFIRLAEKVAQQVAIRNASMNPEKAEVQN